MTETKQSDTPRVDDALWTDGTCPTEFARQLERELAEAKALLHDSQDAFNAAKEEIDRLTAARQDDRARALAECVNKLKELTRGTNGSPWVELLEREMEEK